MASNGGKQDKRFVDGLSELVSDIPPAVPKLNCAVCRTPTELLAQRRQFGGHPYAVNILDDDSGRLKDVWFFSGDLQEAVAIGMRWHERDCSLEQYLVQQDGELVYSYGIRNLSCTRDIEHLFNMRFLWDEIGEDVNSKATPEIMTRLRMALFEFVAKGSDVDKFMLLDFSQPDGEAEYLSDWAAELEG